MSGENQYETDSDFSLEQIERLAIANDEQLQEIAEHMSDSHGLKCCLRFLLSSYAEDKAIGREMLDDLMRAVLDRRVSDLSAMLIYEEELEPVSLDKVTEEFEGILDELRHPQRRRPRPVAIPSLIVTEEISDDDLFERFFNNLSA